MAHGLPCCSIETIVRQGPDTRYGSECVLLNRGTSARHDSRRRRFLPWLEVVLIALGISLEPRVAWAQTPRMPVERLSPGSLLELSIHPNVLPPATDASVILTIANVSGEASFALNPGDSFALSLDPNTETFV